MRHLLKNLKVFSLFVLVSTTILIAQSTDVKTLTERAISAYENGNYITAVKELERALEIMKNKQGNVLNALLPKTMPGWTRGENSSKPMDPRGILGGHLVEQTYKKGEGFVTATLILEAPMVKDVRQTINNPQMTQVPGTTIEQIFNKKALVRYYVDQKQGEISIVANNTTVAVVYGQNVSRRELLNYAKSFNFSEISKIK